MNTTAPYSSLNLTDNSPVQPASVPSNPKVFADEPEGSITLQQAIDIAIVNNPEILARRWDATVMAARQEEFYGERLPKLSVVGAYTHSLDSQRLIAANRDREPGLFSRNIVGGDLVLSMPLFTGGRLINQVKAADLLQQAASHRLSRSREEIVFNISSVFFGILAQRRVIESLEFSQRTLSEHLKRIDALIQAQKAAKVDRMRTEVRLADINQLLVREKNLMVIQSRTLISLLGQKAHIKEINPQGELESQETKMVPDLETALKKAWQERADYLGALSALEAQAFNVDVAKSGHWPVLSFKAAYGGRWATGSSTGSGDEQGDVGRVGVVMELPVFDGGQTKARVREQNASLSAGQERLRAIVFQVRLDVETALLNVESSQERAAAIQKSTAQARESLRIEQQKYDLGRGAIVDVLDAQNALLGSETTYYRVLADFHTALAQLKLAMGEE